MKQYLFDEKTTPYNLFVIVSTKISKQILAIDNCNQDNPEALSEWHDYLDTVKRYLSNPSIAYDYANRFSKFPNGARFIKDFLSINTSVKIYRIKS